MSQDSDDLLLGKLDLLERTGLRHLDRLSHRSALERSYAFAIPAALALSVPLLIWSWLAGPSPVAIVGVWVALAGSAFVGIYLLLRRRDVPGRPRALAVFDRRLALKDRIAMTDEFVRRPDRDRFRAAALVEAAPSVDRALAEPLDIVGPSPHRAAGRRWPLVLAGLVGVALAVFLRGGGMDDATDRASSTGVAARQAAPQANVSTGTTPWAALLRRLGIRDGSRDAGLAGDAGRSGAASAAAGRAAASAGPAGPEQQGSPGDDGQSASTAHRADADAAAGGAAGGAGKGEGGGAAKGGSAGESGEAGQQQTRIEADAAGGGEDADAGRGAAQQRDGMTAGGAQNPVRPDQPSPTAPSAATNGQQQQQGNQGSPGQQGDSGAGKSGQGDGEGGGGQRSNNEEASKRARGVPRLLLAVPMRDRLIGTPNRGPVTSVLRDGRPQAFASGRVAAQGRGTAGGDAGRIAHRPATEHEDRLVRAFFRRTPGGDGR